MTNKTKTAIAVGVVGATVGVSLLLMQKAVPSQKFVIGWDSTGESNIVYQVRRLKTNNFAVPSTNWPVVATTKFLQHTVTVDKAATCVWFTVSASNVVTKLTSDVARKTITQ